MSLLKSDFAYMVAHGSLNRLAISWFLLKFLNENFTSESKKLTIRAAGANLVIAKQSANRNRVYVWNIAS